MKKKKAFVIGVGGLIGSGKSTVCRYLRDNFGFYWIEADKITRELYKRGNAGYKKIQDYFGKTYVGSKEVNRGRLRKMLIKSPQKIWILNKLMHPLIAQEVNKKIVQLNEQHEDENPLLVCIEAVYFEANDLGKFVDQIFVVNSSQEDVMRRLKGRKIPVDDVRVLYKFQKRYIPSNGIIIENNGSTEKLYETIAEKINKVLK